MHVNLRRAWRFNGHHSVNNAVLAKEIFRRARIVAGQAWFDAMDFQVAVGHNFVKRAECDRPITGKPSSSRRWIACTDRCVGGTHTHTGEEVQIEIGKKMFD